MGRNRRRATHGGFTLIEILVVLAIIGLIAGTIGRAVYKNWVEGRLKIAQIQVREVARTVEQFVISREQCPTLDQLLDEGYLQRAAKDPWGTPLQLHCPGRHRHDAADVVSAGPDKQLDTADDIKSWDP